MAKSYISKGSINSVHERVLEIHGHLTCEICGRAYKLEIAHKVAKGMGGRHNEAAKLIDHPDNLMLLCYWCHRRLSHHESPPNDGIHGCDGCPISHFCEKLAVNVGLRNE